MKYILHVKQYNKYLANLNVKFCRHIILLDSTKNSQWKTENIYFHYLLLKNATFISQSLEL